MQVIFIAVAKHKYYSTTENSTTEAKVFSQNASFLINPDLHSKYPGPMARNAFLLIWQPPSAHKAECAQSNIEDEERVESNSQAILHDPAASQNTHTGRHGPENKKDEDGNTRDPVQMHR